jgi:hypothetical protein
MHPAAGGAASLAWSHQLRYASTHGRCFQRSLWLIRGFGTAGPMMENEERVPPVW